MHAWLSLALPDVSERPTIFEDNNEATMIYESTFVGTVLKCKYRQDLKKKILHFIKDTTTYILFKWSKSN